MGFFCLKSYPLNTGILKSFNVFSVIGICLITAFCSVFYIGSVDQYKILIDQLPYSFVFRVMGVSAIGLAALAILITVNFLFDKVFMEKVDTLALRQLAYFGSFFIILIAFAGCLLFFLG